MCLCVCVCVCVCWAGGGGGGGGVGITDSYFVFELIMTCIVEYLFFSFRSYALETLKRGKSQIF